MKWITVNEWINVDGLRGLKANNTCRVDKRSLQKKELWSDPPYTIKTKIQCIYFWNYTIIGELFKKKFFSPLKTLVKISSYLNLTPWRIKNHQKKDSWAIELWVVPGLAHVTYKAVVKGQFELRVSYRWTSSYGTAFKPFSSYESKFSVSSRPRFLSWTWAGRLEGWT